MIQVRGYRKSIERVAPDFASMAVGDRRFFANWSLRQISYALEKHNQFYQAGIEIRCQSVNGRSETRVTPGVVVRRVK